VAIFGQLLTAMASPFRTDGGLDLDGAQQLAAHLLDHGSDGVVVAGTTGESPTLTHAETLELFRAVVEAVGDRGRVIAGVGKNDTAATVSLAEEAAATGVDGLLVVTPYYNKPSQRGLLNHYSMVAQATDLPVIVYNIPGRTACEMTPDTLLRLATGVETIKGVKDAVGDLTKTAWLANRAPDDFDILAGDDAITLPMLAVGGVGVISVSSHVVGPDMAEMIDVFATDPAKARSIHHRLLELFTTLMTVDTSPAPLKAALNLLGLPGGPVRPPLADVDGRGQQRIREALQAVGVALP
jgi:4-hydroxy-tetrahydrodipicolinate synthase